MAHLNWESLNDKLFSELNNDGNTLSQKEYTNSKNQRVVDRTFADMASIRTIGRNIDVQEERDASGIISHATLDYTN